MSDSTLALHTKPQKCVGATEDPERAAEPVSGNNQIAINGTENGGAIFANEVAW